MKARIRGLVDQFGRGQAFEIATAAALEVCPQQKGDEPPKYHFLSGDACRI